MWVPKIFRQKIEFREHLKPRTTYLWAMLRMAVNSRGYLEELEEKREEILDRNFGLRSMNLRVEEHEVEEIDEDEDLARRRHIAEMVLRDKLPWYLLDE